MNKKKTHYRWFVLAMIFCIYAVAGADRSNIGMVVPYMKESFSLSNTDIGAMASFFYLAYAIVQIPAGHLYSKKGIRGFYSISILLTSIATFIMGIADSAMHLKGARTLLGLAEGPINIGSITTINKWFPTQEKGMATGIYLSSIKFAPAFVPPLCAWIILSFGWRTVFYAFAIPGIFLAVLWYILIRDNPRNSQYTNEAEVYYIEHPTITLNNVKNESATTIKNPDGAIDKIIRTKLIEPLSTNSEILRSWSIWADAAGYFFLVAITYTIMTWIPTYLAQVKQFTIIKVGLVASAPWVGAVLGNIIGGTLSDKLFHSRRKPVMLITAISTVFLMYSLKFAPDDMTILGILLLLAGIFLNLGYSMFLAYPMGIATKEKVSFAASIVNTAGSLGGAFGPFAVGLILDSFGWDSVFPFLASMSAIVFILLLTMIEPLQKTPSTEDTIEKHH